MRTWYIESGAVVSLARFERLRVDADAVGSP